jgi:CRISPR-associated endonuclease/helicase Cas3
MFSQDFSKVFETLTGSSPFPWQTVLYHRLMRGDFPSSVSLPTGLGKTSIIAIWLCALVTKSTATTIPRRLVYVVNRRTVVDQTTAEVEQLRTALKHKPELTEICNVLTNLCVLPLPANTLPLAVSTLRGQFADNGEWCADPTRPAVIVGTVDMIGSGLLFSRYTRGFKTRPLHAGFLGQDSLLVHDEAHLEPAFQTLLESIVTAQNAGKDPRPLRVLALSATNRSALGAKPFGLDENPNDKDSNNPIIQKRIHATKRLSLVALGKDDKLDDKLVELVKARPEERAVLIFARSVETAMQVATELDKSPLKRKVALLTGTMRGQERDDLVDKNPVFQRFLTPKDRAKNVEPASGTVFLVATSAGEVRPVHLRKHGPALRPCEPLW